MKNLFFRLKLAFAKLFVNRDLPDFICISMVPPEDCKYLKYGELYYYPLNGKIYMIMGELKHTPLSKLYKNLFNANYVLDTKLKINHKSRSGKPYNEIIKSVPDEIKRNLKHV